MTAQTDRTEEQSGKSGSGFLYFLIGAGLGSLIALLCAPQSGRETRDLVAQKAQDAKDYAQRKAQEVQDRAESLVEQGKNAVREKTQQVTAAVDAGREAYNREIAKGKASTN